MCFAFECVRRRATINRFSTGMFIDRWSKHIRSPHFFVPPVPKIGHKHLDCVVFTAECTGQQKKKTLNENIMKQNQHDKANTEFFHIIYELWIINNNEKIAKKRTTSTMSSEVQLTDTPHMRPHLNTTMELTILVFGCFWNDGFHPKRIQTLRDFGFRSGTIEVRNEKCSKSNNLKTFTHFTFDKKNFKFFDIFVIGPFLFWIKIKNLNSPIKLDSFKARNSYKSNVLCHRIEVKRKVAFRLEFYCF